MIASRSVCLKESAPLMLDAVRQQIPDWHVVQPSQGCPAQQGFALTLCPN